MSDNNYMTQVAGILSGGAVGFLSSLFLDPVKRLLFRPDLQVDFPIRENTNIQEASITTYLPFIVEPVNPGGRLLKSEPKIGIRCRIKNNSRFYKGESCRVSLASIETRKSPEQDWQQSEYKESNQVAWAEPQIRFEAVDIFPWTNKAVELLLLYPKNAVIEPQISQKHFTFSYLFPFPTPQDHGWLFCFLLTGQNFLPISFQVTIEYLCQEVEGQKIPFLHVNGCPLDMDKLVTRGFMDTKEYASLKADQKAAAPTKINNIPM